MENKLKLTGKTPHGDLAKTLAERLRAYIVETGMAKGQRFLSHREICRLSGVSQVTARMAVKQLERDGVLENRAGQGQRGTFVRCDAALAGAISRPLSRRVGIILSPWDRQDAMVWNDSALLSGLVRGRDDDSLVQFLLLGYQQWRQEADIEQLVAHNGLDAIIWMYVGPQEIASVERLHQRNFPQVLLNVRPGGLKCAAVLQDDVGAARHMVASLRDEELGSLLILCSEAAMTPYAERMAAVEAALTARGGTLDLARVVRLPEVPYPTWAAAVLESQLAQWRPAAVLDLIGYTLPLRAAAERVGQQIGADFRLLSVHQLDAIEGTVDVPYRYYRYDLVAAGRRAFELACQQLQARTRLDGDQAEYLPFQVVDHLSPQS